jgi:hypothetical protein
MDTVWIRTHDDSLIRAKSITTLQNWRDGLYTECITGSRVQLTNGPCPIACQLVLLEEIRQAGADDSRAVVIMPVWKQGALIWHREFADALADRLKAHDSIDRHALAQGASFTDLWRT